jgi:hypothetical protein
MAKIKISKKLGSELLKLLGESAELLQESGASLYRPVESELQSRMNEAGRLLFNKLMGFAKDTE